LFLKCVAKVGIFSKYPNIIEEKVKKISDYNKKREIFELDNKIKDYFVSFVVIINFISL